jgi:hypothetical protein
MYLRQCCKEMVGMYIAVSVEQWTGRWQKAQKARRARSKAQRRQGRSRESGEQQGGCGASRERERGERNATQPVVCVTATGAQASSDGRSGRRPAAPGSSAIALLCMRASSADDCAALCCSRHGQGPWCRSREQQRQAARWRQGRLRRGRRVRRERTCPASRSAAEPCSMTCVRWDSVGGQQALLSAAATATRAVQRRVCPLRGLERAIGPLAARSGCGESSSNSV